MHFCRPAKKEDFNGYDIEYDHGRYMSDRVKELIEQDDLEEALRVFNSESKLGYGEAQKYLIDYQKYVFAKKDFDNGQPVFVSY